MTLRRIETISSVTTGKYAKVFRDSEWNEYRVQFFTPAGEHQTEADYLTDDKGDAQRTARAVIWHGKA